MQYIADASRHTARIIFFHTRRHEFKFEFIQLIIEMANRIRLENFQVVTEDFEVDDPDVIALLPTVNIQQTCEFDLHGVDNAIANALRRTVMGEIPVRTMNFDMSDLSTDNKFILVDMIQTRFRMIPIRQTASGTFKLSCVNNTTALMRVFSSEITRVTGPKHDIFNETFELFTLYPGQYLRIDNIYIDTGYGYTHACHTVATSGRILPLSEKPWDEFTQTGVHSSESAEKSFRLAFNTNGTINPKDIVTLACDTLIARAEGVLTLLDNMGMSSGDYTLNIPNESPTIGELLDRTIFRMYPHIEFVSTTKASIGRSITLKLRTEDDPKEMVTRALAAIVGYFTEIKSAIA